MAEPGNPNRYPGYRRVDVPSLDREKAALREKVVGQEEGVASFASLYVKIKSGVRPVKPSPLDVKFLLGPSGVGKTEIVYALAELLAEGDPKARDKVIKINGGDYQDSQEHGISRLFGVPPGFVGAERPDEPGTGTKAIFSPQNLDAHKIPYVDRNGQQKRVNLILIDEAEKAGRLFHMAFLPILDKGEADLANNSKADFKDAVFLYTSNIGHAVAEQQHGQRPTQTDIPAAFQEAVEDVAFKDEERNTIIKEFTQTFPPEFRGRIQEPIVFNHLSHEAVSVITRMKIKEVEAAFAASGIRIELDVPADVREWLNKNGSDRSEGARGMDKLIKGQIMEKLLAFDAARDVDVLATGIDRKRIAVGVSDDGAELEFYFGAGYQLPELTQQADQVWYERSAGAFTPLSDEVEYKTCRPPTKEELRKTPEPEVSSSRRQLYERRKWEEVLGAEVEISPLPETITPEVVSNLLKLGMELRFIPRLRLEETEDFPSDYATHLKREYPNWRWISEFWNEVQKGNINLPQSSGKWMAVDIMPPTYKYHEQQEGASPLIKELGLKSRFNNKPKDIFDLIAKRNFAIMRSIGLESHHRIKLLEAVEWDLLANREGWNVTTNNYELSGSEWRNKHFGAFVGMTRTGIGHFYPNMSYDHVGFRLGIDLEH